MCVLILHTVFYSFIVIDISYTSLSLGVSPALFGLRSTSNAHAWSIKRSLFAKSFHKWA